MRILFADVFDAESALTWSGIPSRVLEQLRMREEVILCHKLNRIMRLVYLPYVLECKLRGLRPLQMDRHILVAQHYAHQVRRAYERYKPDLVFSAGTPFALAYLPAQIPTAFWGDALMNQLVDFYWPSAKLNQRIVEAGKKLDKLVIQKSKASIFSSEWAANSARQWVPESSDRIFFVPFGANTMSEPMPGGPKCLPVDLSQTVNFLFVGVDWNRKGGQDAVDALTILRSEGYNVHLSLVGASPFPDGLHSDFIRQYGFLRRDIGSDKELFQRLGEEAHFFIMPTHAECSPIVFAEAASYGLPIIARDVGGVRSMLDGNSILIGADDEPTGLADAIRPLLSDPERYRAMSAASLEVSRHRLNWKSAVGQIVEIFEKVIETRQA